MNVFFATSLVVRGRKTVKMPFFHVPKAPKKLLIYTGYKMLVVPNVDIQDIKYGHSFLFWKPHPWLCMVCVKDNMCTYKDKSASVQHRVIHLLKQRRSLMFPTNLLSDGLAATEQQENQRSMKNLMLTR